MKSALKRKHHAIAILVPQNPRLERANECTAFLQRFEKSVNGWVDLALIFAEVERDQLFLEVGSKTVDDWIRQHAPISCRLCYAIKARYKALKGAGLSDSELRLMPKESAEWASKARNISPAALSKPEVKEALRLPKQKAIKMLQEVVPEQHCENTVTRHCRFAVSQDDVIQRAYQVFRMTKDKHASLEDAIEFWASEWVLSTAQVKA